MCWTQEEEIASLEAIFCKKDEFTVRKDADGLHVTLNFDWSYLIDLRVVGQSRGDSADGISFLLAPEYPCASSPRITVRCSYLSAGIIDVVQQQVEERASALQGQFMLLDLCSLAQERLEREIETFQAAMLKAVDIGIASQFRAQSISTATQLQADDISMTSTRLNAQGIGTACHLNKNDNGTASQLMTDVVDITKQLKTDVVCTTSQIKINSIFAISQPEKSTAIIQRNLQDQSSLQNDSTPNPKLPAVGPQIQTSELNITNDKDMRTRSPSWQENGSNRLHKEKALDNCGQNFDKCERGSKAVTALLQLDHMRSKTSYVKLIKKWSVELRLSGRLIFCKKLILILLQGESNAVKEYIVRNRTTNVDTDSKGRACKERMLSVLCEVPAQTQTRLSEFCVVDLPTTESLRELFQNSAMEYLFLDHVVPLVRVSSTKKNSSEHQK